MPRLNRPVPVLSSRPFVVHAATLARVVGTTRHEQRSGVIEGLGTLSVVVPDGECVDAEVSLSSYSGGILVRGTVSARWQGTCRRCACVVSGVLEVPVRERYVAAASAGSPLDQSDPGEDVYLFTDGILDLEPLARDALLLHLPLAPLCSEQCQGLCPQCGADLNVESCTCQSLPDPRWATLDQLRDVESGGLA